jgi:hypothetical protein
MNRLHAVVSVAIGWPLICGATLSILLLTGMGTEESRYFSAQIAGVFFVVQAAIAGTLLWKRKNLSAVLVVWGPVGIVVAAVDLVSSFSGVFR